VATSTLAMVSGSSAPVLAKDMSRSGGNCCGDDSHSQGVSCASGCGAVCSTAIDIASSGVDLPDGSIGHVLLRQDGVVSTKLSPEFRPPRNFA
jgi:hypothetical protein